MKQLNDLVKHIAPLMVVGPLDIAIDKLTADSRQAAAQTLFVAVKGTAVDGHAYIGQAIANGATAIVAQQPAPENCTVTWIQTADSALTLGQLADIWYGRPSSQLQLVAVTGTNGKTSVATLLYQLVRKMGYKAGLLSTVNNRINDRVVPSQLTTPDVLTIHQLLANMVAQGCTYAFMEASSHAIHQQRLAGLQLAGAVFTNLTQDHLDYHGTMKAYLAAKKILFDNLPPSAFALVNTDDRNGPVMLQNCRATHKTYGLRRAADFKCKVLENSIEGLHLEINNREVMVRLVGSFNAYNLMAVYGVARLLQLENDEVLTALSTLEGAEGRFDLVTTAQSSKIGIVDYAHTPDALHQVLDTLRQLNSRRAQIITVVGCGGNRDTDKRPKMAAIAAKLSDKVVLTSDNPRLEDPEAILDDMERGFDPEQRSRALRITDRGQAIRTAVMLANHGDIILVAGKGHEKYQDIQGKKLPFDDKEVLRAALHP
jgi:UDP-N-acetylmuramoyl-L-alanyl-D-glutamate--2,6-diaminopimelate ligase